MKLFVLFLLATFAIANPVIDRLIDLLLEEAVAEAQEWDKDTTYDKPCTLISHLDPVTGKVFEYQNYNWVHGTEPNPQLADGYETPWRFPGGANINMCKPPEKPLENVCLCEHGTEATGEKCTANLQEICESCSDGYKLESDICIKDEPEKCTVPAPPESAMEKDGRACKSLGGDKYDCINGNQKYHDFNTAWKKCGEIEGCAYVQKEWDYFRLRRIDDPVGTQYEGRKLIKFQCHEESQNVVVGAQEWDKSTIYDKPCNLVSHLDPATGAVFEYQNYFYTVGDEPNPQLADGYDTPWRFIGASSNICDPPATPVEKVCTCEYGAAATGEKCTENLQEICESCSDGYKLESGICIKDEPEECNVPAPPESAMEDNNARACVVNNNAACINNNQKYDSLESAWKKCGEIEGCALIQKEYSWFRLRRIDDPQASQTQISNGHMKLIKFQCHEEQKSRKRKQSLLERLARLMTKDKTANKAATQKVMANHGVNIANVMEKFDINKDNKLSADEIKEVFQDYDQNGNGVEDVKAIRKAIRALKGKRKRKEKSKASFMAFLEKAVQDRNHGR